MASMSAERWFSSGCVTSHTVANGTGTGMSVTLLVSMSVSSGFSEALRMMHLLKPVRRLVGGKDADLDGIAKVPDCRLDLIEHDVELRALVGLRRQRLPRLDECRFGVGFVEALGIPDEAVSQVRENLHAHVRGRATGEAHEGGDALSIRRCGVSHVPLPFSSR